MIATGGALASIGRAHEMGLRAATTEVDPDLLRKRIRQIEQTLERGTRTLLDSQGVTILNGSGRLTGPNQVVAETADGEIELEADAVLLSTGSRPRLPDWAEVDGKRDRKSAVEGKSGSGRV